MEITKRLQQSLHNAVRLTLGMERRDDAVSLPWEAMWYRPEKPPEPLPAGTRVSAVFQETQQQLLILGEPGSGKTTTMLELARDLLEKAKADNTQPIPVLVSLSSWKKPEVGIFEWLVAELKAKYGLRQDIGKAWMQNRVLLPLLDGLDEVTPSLQQQCAEAMNAWLTGDLEKQPCGVLVCCRREEFETIVRQKLDLQGAIYLQALTPVQIEEYFSQLNLPEVWQTLGDDAALRELLTKPLFLSMFGLVQVQGKFELAAWQAKATSEAKIEYLFETYWDAVMSRDLIFDPHEKKLGWRSKTYKKAKPPLQNVVRHYLVFLASTLKNTHTDEFILDRLQSLRQWNFPKWNYWILLFFVSFLFNIINSFIFIFPYCINLSLSIFTYISSAFYSGFGLAILTYTESKSDLLLILEFPFICLFCKLLKYELPKKYQKQILILNEIVFDLKFRIKILTKQEIINLFLSLIKISSLLPDLFKKLLFIWLDKLCLQDNFKNKVFFKVVFNIFYVFLYIINIILEVVGLPLLIIFEIFYEEVIFEKIDKSGGMLREQIKRFVVIFITQIIFIAGLVINHSVSYWMPFVSFITVLSICACSQNLLKHLSLRIILWLYQLAPWQYTKFLDYCTERLLIQRIGGRYRFTHKLLQDYFAKMELD